MDYPTKKKRLLALLDSYMGRVGRPVSMEEVAEWALKNNLYPVPNKSAPVGECEAWERRLEECDKKDAV